MKKILPLFFVLLLLCGCGREMPEETTPPPATTEHVAEELVCFGDAPSGDIYAMGMSLLVYDGTTFTAIGNGACTLRAEGARAVAAGTLGAAYYKDGTVTLLNPRLQVNDTLPLPENTDCVPVVDVDGRRVFYTAGGELRMINFGDKLPRLLRTYENVTLLPRAVSGNVLRCLSTNALGQTVEVSISVENGSTLSSEPVANTFLAFGEDCLSVRQDGLYTCNVWHRAGKEDADLRLPEGYAPLGITLQGTVVASGAHIVLLDSEGRQTAESTLPSPVANAQGGSVLWVKCEDGKLYRWSAVPGEAADFGTALRKIYTADAPDTAGIAELKARAKKLKSKFKCNILLDTTAVSRTGGHDLEREYQTDTVKNTIDAIEEALPGAKLPKNFSICIVRSVDGKAEPAHFKQGRFTFLLLPAGADASAALESLS